MSNAWGVSKVLDLGVSKFCGVQIFLDLGEFAADDREVVEQESSSSSSSSPFVDFRDSNKFTDPLIMLVTDDMFTPCSSRLDSDNLLPEMETEFLPRDFY